MRILVAFGLGILLLGTGTSATAQTRPPVEIGVGYAPLRIIDPEGLTLPIGWFAEVSGSIADFVSIVGEVAGGYKSEEGETLSVYTFQGGVRFVSRQNPKVRPFGNFLLGLAHARWEGESDSALSIEPGGGVDVLVGSRTALRFGIGFPIGFFEGDSVTSVRFLVGVVF